jgi:hypothetical protein
MLAVNFKKIWDAIATRLSAASNLADLAAPAAALNNILPSQTGNNGKYLTTNGTSSSWAAVSGGDGAVTSVALTVPSILSVAGSPVTTAGTLALSLVSQSQNKIFAAPSTGAGVPAFRYLQPSDIPSGLPYLSTDGGILTGGIGLNNHNIEGVYTLTFTSTASGIYFANADTSIYFADSGTCVKSAGLVDTSGVSALDWGNRIIANEYGQTAIDFNTNLAIGVPLDLTSIAENTATSGGIVMRIPIVINGTTYYLPVYDS